MRALVTGATGFLGSRVARELLERGDRVAVLARPTSKQSELADVRDRIGVYVIDERPETLDAILAAERPDVVVHVATYYQRDHGPQDVAPMLEANVAFPLRLVDAMARAGIRRFINTASAWQYTDAQTYRPVCLHSATKHAFEALLAYFVDSGSIDAITLIMHDTYGPDDPRRKIFGILREHAGRTEPLAMSGGEQVLNLIHVRDAAAAYRVAADRLLARAGTCAAEHYTVSGGQPRTLRAIVETYLRHAAIDVPIYWGGRDYHPREVMHAWQGGAVLPGWTPCVDLDAGLRDLAASATAPTASRALA